MPVPQALCQLLLTQIGLFRIVERLVVIGELVGEAEGVKNCNFPLLVDEHVAGTYVAWFLLPALEGSTGLQEVIKQEPKLSLFEI